MSGRLISFFAGVLFLAYSARAANPIKFDTLKVGSKTYRHVTILGSNVTDLYFMHDHGIANVKLKNLDPKLQKRFNYDPVAAEEAERQQLEDEKRYDEQGVSNMVAQAEQAAVARAKAAQAEKRASVTSEDNLADPVSESSLIGKAAPTLDVEKWITDKPDIEKKALLIVFWEPWSIPSKKWIVEMNALQKKFADKLVIVGITSESEADVSEMTDTKIEFAAAIDTKSKLSAAVGGVTSVPYVVLANSKKIVCYAGHPAALTEEKLRKILAKSAE